MLTEVLTMTNTPQEVPSLSFSVNPTTPQVLQVTVTLDASAQDANCPVILARPYVDNVQVGPVMTLQGSVRTTISTTRQVNLSAGSHSVTFKAWCEVGSGNIIMTGQSSVAYLLFSQ